MSSSVYTHPTGPPYSSTAIPSQSLNTLTRSTSAPCLPTWAEMYVLCRHRWEKGTN